MKRTFTFGITVYNHEDVILECLESIKYQILKYGQDVDFRLIITDDCSKDASVQVMRSWLTQNQSLFAQTLLIANEKNLGVVPNYHRILDELDANEDFHLLAGDDVLSSANLLTEFQDLDNKKLKTYFKVILRDGQIYYPANDTRRFYWNQYHRGNYMRKFRRGSYIHSPSTIYKKALYDASSCTSFNSQFRLFEDDPTWYAMLKHMQPNDLSFENEIIVLYRVHGTAISNGNDLGPFALEQRRLHKIYQTDTKGLEKIYWAFHNLYLSGSARFLDPAWWSRKIEDAFIAAALWNNSGFKAFKAQMDARIAQEQAYYHALCNAVTNEN